MADAARPPFRADHVGSLLRPPALKTLRLDRDAGRVDAAALRAAEDAAVREVVRLQEAAGLQGITDGEMRRQSWHMDFLLQLGGSSSQGQRIPVTFHGKAGDVNFTRPDLAITSRVTRPKPIFVEGVRVPEVRRHPHAQADDPVAVHALLAGGPHAHRPRGYPDLDAFVADTAAAYRAEIADLYAAGCRYLQLDDVSLAYLCDEEMRAQNAARGEDPDAQLRLSVQLVQQTLRDKPRT